MKQIRRSITALIIATIMTLLMLLAACGVNDADNNDIDSTEITPGSTLEYDKNMWDRLEDEDYIDRDTLEKMLDETKKEIELQHQRNLQAIESGFKKLRDIRPGVPEENYETYFLNPYVTFYEELLQSIDEYCNAISGTANLVFMGGTGATELTLRETVLYARNVLNQLKRFEDIAN